MLTAHFTVRLLGQQLYIRSYRSSSKTFRLTTPMSDLPPYGIRWSKRPKTWLHTILSKDHPSLHQPPVLVILLHCLSAVISRRSTLVLFPALCHCWCTTYYPYDDDAVAHGSVAVSTMVSLRLDHLRWLCKRFVFGDAPYKKPRPLPWMSLSHFWFRSLRCDLSVSQAH